MTGLRKTLIIWFVLMGLFLCGVIALDRYGERWVDTLEARSKTERGLGLESERRFDEALSLYEEALQSNDRNPELRRLLARVCTKLGRFQDAEIHATRRVELSVGEGRRDALLELVRIYRAMGRWDKASEMLSDILHVSASSAEAHHEMAEVAEGMGNYPRMVTELREVAKLQGQDSSQEYIDALGRRKREIADLERRITAQEASGEYYHALGILCLEIGQWDKAVKAFVKAVDSPQVGPDACFWLGVNAEVSGDRDAAAAMYERAVTACPNHLEALIGLKRTRLSEQG